MGKEQTLEISDSESQSFSPNSRSPFSPKRRSKASQSFTKPFMRMDTLRSQDFSDFRKEVKNKKKQNSKNF